MEQSTCTFLKFIFFGGFVGLFSNREQGAATDGFSLKQTLFISTVQK